MRKLYLIIGLLTFILTYCVSASQPTWTKDVEDVTTPLTVTIIGMVIVIIVALLVMYYAVHTHTQRVHDRYDEELRRLDRQLKDKEISEDTYRDLKRDLEKKYRWYT